MSRHFEKGRLLVYGQAYLKAEAIREAKEEAEFQKLMKEVFGGMGNEDGVMKETHDMLTREKDYHTDKQAALYKSWERQVYHNIQDQISDNLKKLSPRHISSKLREFLPFFYLLSHSLESGTPPSPVRHIDSCASQDLKSIELLAHENWLYLYLVLNNDESPGRTTGTLSFPGEFISWSVNQSDHLGIKQDVQSRASKRICGLRIKKLTRVVCEAGYEQDRYAKAVGERKIFRDIINTAYNPFELSKSKEHSVRYSTRDIIDPVKHDLEKVLYFSVLDHNRIHEELVLDTMKNQNSRRKFFLLWCRKRGRKCS